MIWRSTRLQQKETPSPQVTQKPASADKVPSLTPRKTRIPFSHFETAKWCHCCELHYPLPTVLSQLLGYGEVVQIHLPYPNPTQLQYGAVCYKGWSYCGKYISLCSLTFQDSLNLLYSLPPSATHPSRMKTTTSSLSMSPLLKNPASALVALP